MREIEFRGKRTDTGEWVFGFLDKGCFGSFYIGTNSYMSEIRPETVGQYTGLKDSNGVKIFEGDIIRYVPLEEYCVMEERDEKEDGQTPGYWTKGVIKWMGYEDYPAFDLDRHSFESNAISALFGENYIIEVIGNIHDNPELLEEAL